MPQRAHLRVIAETPPIAVNGTVPPLRRPKPADARRHLTPTEVEQLMEAAGKRGRYGHRDRTLILVAYRHGLRAGEVVALRWDQVDLDGGSLFVSRLKHGRPSTHPLQGPTIRALRRLQREQATPSPYVFTSERDGPMTTDGVRKLVARAGREAGLPFHIHPHMLRHACGYKLAADGQDTRAIQAYLGHASIGNTVKYTELAPGRFRNFWRD
jgi:type 1 fimbriae regulatory protein FimE